MLQVAEMTAYLIPGGMKLVSLKASVIARIEEGLIRGDKDILMQTISETDCETIDDDALSISLTEARGTVRARDFVYTDPLSEARVIPFLLATNCEGAEKELLPVVYHPLSRYPTLFREFAEIEKTPEKVLAFASKYGPINNFTQHASGRYCSLLVDWYVASDRLADAISRWEEAIARGKMDVFVRKFNLGLYGGGVLNPQLIFGEGGALSLAISAPTLYGIMWYQLCQAITGEVLTRKCGWCGTWFTYGAGTGRRKSAQFCSDKCRKAAWAAGQTGD